MYSCCQQWEQNEACLVHKVERLKYLPFGKVSAASQNADGSLGSDWLADVFIDAHFAMKL